jgi:hypothetical protein
MVSMPAQYAFDFGCWMRLARSDPQAFERRRREVLEAVIRQAAPARRHRLEGLQCRIDLERRRARTPMAACLRLSSMMWESVNDELAPALRRLVSGDGPTSGPGPGHRSATVIPFARR